MKKDLVYFACVTFTSIMSLWYGVKYLIQFLWVIFQGDDRRCIYVCYNDYGEFLIELILIPFMIGISFFSVIFIYYYFGLNIKNPERLK